MKELLAPIDQAGRVVLPKDVREELALEAGDLLVVKVQSNSVMLTPNKKGQGLVRRGKALVFATAGRKVLTNEMVNEVLDASRQESLERSMPLRARKN